VAHPDQGYRPRATQQRPEANPQTVMETVQNLLRYPYSKYVFLLLIALIQYLLPLKAKAGNIMFFGPTLDELWSVTFFLALIGLLWDLSSSK
jgi:hypothetical protein